MPIKLEVRNITKSFPGVKALDNISFRVRKGTTHVLCGENGAGKSTLMKIINGIYTPDQGTVLLDGKEVAIENPIHARSLGISMIFQELSYVPEMTVAENIFLGRWPKTRMGRVDHKAMRMKTQELLKQEQLPYSPDQKLKDLSVSDIQMLEILKAVSNNSDVIIMDEPTSAITQKETKQLFGKIEEMKKRGACVIYISHKLEEVFQIADEITVLRDGCIVDTKPAAELDIDQVITMMVGRKMDSKYPFEQVKTGKPVLDIKGLTGDGFRDISFHVNEGEIVGFAGLMGAGRTETMRAIFGIDRYETGEASLHGKPLAKGNIRRVIDQGLVMLSEDRRRYGLVPIRSVLENASLPNLKQFIYKGRLHSRQEHITVSEACRSMNVKTPTLETTVEALSGGNQQKIVLAKWMIRNPDVLLMDEPTRGIDVGAKYEIYKLMIHLAQKGKGLVMVSSELPELLGMCNRIYVMCQGRIAGEITRSEFSAEAIMALATGIAGNAS
jgi:inositol transport system ATP-binding protein